MRRAAEIIERRRARFVEAAFTGSKPAAEKGELVYYVGATEAALREARPILEASSKEIIHIGAIGQASGIKVATNMITAASIQAAAEALALIKALGLPFEKFIEAMRANASYSSTLAMKLPKMLDRDFDPQFSVKHMLKDMQIASQIALSHYLDLGVTAAARDQLLEQVQWGHGDDDYSVVARKYLHETESSSYEEPQTEEESDQVRESDEFLSPSETDERITGSADVETQNLRPEDTAAAVSAQQPLPGFGRAESAATAASTRLRRGFLRQLLSRLSSGKE
jgi:hypothetical protein